MFDHPMRRRLPSDDRRWQLRAMIPRPRTAWLGIVALCLGCAAEPAQPGAIEQAGTAGQDVEVAKLRSLFGRARAMPKLAELRPASRSTTGMMSTWQCERRDAKRDAPTVATPVTYAFTATDSGDFYKNVANSFGRDFLPTPSASDLVGYDGPSGAIGEFVTLRLTPAGLILEQFKRPTVANLSPADQATWDALGQQYETAVSGGLATAYTVCNVNKRTRNDVPVVFFDDFDDLAFSRAHWSMGSSSSQPRLSDAGINLGNRDNNYISVGNRTFTEISFYTTLVAGLYFESFEFDAQGVKHANSNSYALRIPTAEGRHYVNIVVASDAIVVKVNDSSVRIPVARAPLSYAALVFSNTSAALTPTLTDVTLK